MLWNTRDCSIQHTENQILIFQSHSENKSCVQLNLHNSTTGNDDPFSSRIFRISGNGATVAPYIHRTHCSTASAPCPYDSVTVNRNKNISHNNDGKWLIKN